MKESPTLVQNLYRNKRSKSSAFQCWLADPTETFGYMLPRLETFFFAVLSIVFCLINLLQKSLPQALSVRYGYHIDTEKLS